MLDHTHEHIFFILTLITLVICTDQAGPGNFPFQLRVIPMVDQNCQPILKILIHRQSYILHDNCQLLIQFGKILPLLFENGHIIVDQSAKIGVADIFMGAIELDKPFGE